MRIISFILQQKSALSLVNWNSLLNKQDPEMLLVLISERGSIDSLSTQAKKRFIAIIELEQFEFVQAKQEMDKINPSILPKALLEKYPLPEANTIIPQTPSNRLESLGCTTTSSYSTFFNKRNLAIGATSMFSQIGTQTTNNMRHYSPVKTEVDSILLFGLLVGSATIVVLLLYALWRASPTKVSNQDDENLVPSQRFL